MGFRAVFEAVTVRIDFVTTDLANLRSTYFFFKARTEGGKFLACSCCFLVIKFDADFLTAPGAIGVVGGGGAGVVGPGFLTLLSLPFSLVASSSLETLETAFEGMLARLKWSSSGGSKFVPEIVEIC